MRFLPILASLTLAACAAKPVPRIETAPAPSKWDTLQPEATWEPGAVLSAEQVARRPALDRLLSGVPPDARAKVEIRARICDLADHLLQDVLRTREIEIGARVQALLHIHGIPAELRWVETRGVDPRDAEALTEMSRRLSRALEGEPRAWVCAASQRLLGHQARQIVYVHLGGVLDLAPLARTYTRGGTVAVDFALATGPRRAPEVLLDGASGAVLAVDARPAPTAADLVQKAPEAGPERYVATLPVEADDGWAWLNLEVDRGQIRTLALALPLWVGAAPMPREAPRLVDPKIGEDAPVQGLLTRIAGERDRAGLPPLERSPRLDAEAQADLERLAAGVDPGARPASEESYRAFENIWRGWGGAERAAEWGAMVARMPFYRRAYLTPAVTEIGAAAERLGDGRFGAVFAVAAPPAAITPAQVQSDLVSQIDEARVDAKLPALDWPASVTKALQAQAETLCTKMRAGGDAPRNAMGPINERLMKLAAVRRLRGNAQLQMVVARPSHFPQLEPFLVTPKGRDTRLASVAGCQGDFPAYGRGFVLLLFYGVKDGRI